MSTHLSDKEIDNFVTGLASGKGAGKAAEHIESCSECRAVAEALLSLFEVQGNDRLPGVNVRKAVLEEWHRIHSEVVNNNQKMNPKYSRFAAAFASAVFAAALAISGYLVFNEIIPGESNTFVLNNSSGEVYVNDSIALRNTRLVTGDIVNTGDNAAASLSAEGCSLFIGESSSVEVSDKRTNEFDFRLLKGSVISKSSGMNHRSFLCGEYIIVPSGTVFMLNYFSNKLEAAVSQGSIVVTGLKSEIHIPSGMKWSSDNPEIIMPADKKILQMMNSDLSAGRSFENNKNDVKSIDSDLKTKTDIPADLNDTRIDETVPDDEVKVDKKDLRQRHEMQEEVNGMKKELRGKKRRG